VGIAGTIVGIGGSKNGYLDFFQNFYWLDDTIK
jgi:hypothetical protein